MRRVPTLAAILAVSLLALACSDTPPAEPIETPPVPTDKTKEEESHEPLEDTASAASLVDEAIRLQEAGSYKKAIAKCNDAIELDPELLQAYTVKAFALLDDEQFAEAKRFADESLVVFPREPSLVFVQAISSEYGGDYEEAIANYELYLEILTDFDEPELYRATLRRVAELEYAGPLATKVEEIISMEERIMGSPEAPMDETFKQLGEFLDLVMDLRYRCEDVEVPEHLSAAHPEIIAFADKYSSAIEKMSRALKSWDSELAEDAASEFEEGRKHLDAWTLALEGSSIQ